MKFARPINKPSSPGNTVSVIGRRSGSPQSQFNDTSQAFAICTAVATTSRKKSFKPPSLEEVKAYCIERGNSIDPERFLNYYESNGWMVGRTKIKNWKAAVRTWEAKDKPSALGPQRKKLEWTTDENGERVAVYAD